MEIPIVCGPTGSGKTNFAIDNFSDNKHIIINADSRQIYKYFNIGTNKGNIEVKSERLKVKGYSLPYIKLEEKINGILFDFLEPNEQFNVSIYKIITEELIEIFLTKGLIPVIVGGTGLYIDSLVKGYNINSEPNNILRSKLNNLSKDELQNILIKSNFNLDDLNNSDKNNKVRLIRLIEKLEDNSINSKNIKPKYKYKLYYPNYNKTKLFNKIDLRVEEMISEGLIKEVQELIKKGFRESIPMKGIGYKEVVAYLDSKISKIEMIEKIKTSHRRYAKRQITWFEGKSRDYKFMYF